MKGSMFFTIRTTPTNWQDSAISMDLTRGQIWLTRTPINGWRTLTVTTIRESTHTAATPFTKYLNVG